MSHMWTKKWDKNRIVLSRYHKQLPVMIARQTSGAEVQGSNPASVTMIRMLKDQCFNIENLRVEWETNPWGKIKIYKKNTKMQKVLLAFWKTSWEKCRHFPFLIATYCYTKETQNCLTTEHLTKKRPELGTRKFFSFATTTTQQCNIAEGTSQGPEKYQKIVRPQCLDGVATMNISKWKLQTFLWPDNMVTLLQQNCRVPSSGQKTNAT